MSVNVLVPLYLAIGPPSRDSVYHVSVMPCYDKKLEASRQDFAAASGNRDVDCVLTTGEVEKILNDKAVILSDYPIDEDANQYQEVEEEHFLPSLVPAAGSSSGGYLHNAILAAIKSYSGSPSDLTFEIKPMRGEDYVEYNLRDQNRVIFRGAKCYGFRNLQNVVRKVGRETGVGVSRGAAGKAAGLGLNSRRGGMMKRAGLGQARASANASPSDSGTSTPDTIDKSYDFIEVMACPSGCVNGGGQISPPKHPLRVGVPVDKEGMPVVEEFGFSPASPTTGQVEEYKLVADVKDGHRVLSGKEWVQRVEEFYWRLGARQGCHARADGDDDCSGTTNSLDDSIKPFFVGQEESQRKDEIAARILQEIVGSAADPDTRRKEILRTQYRAIESEEVNGLAVKW